MSNDADWVPRAQAGDLHAFNQLVITYRERVYSHCYYMLRNPDNAADVTQDSFVKAWRSIGSLRGQFRPWMLSIATNACRDFLRAQKPADTLTPDDLADAHPDPPSTALGPEAEAELSELQTEVRDALDQLPVEQREVILMCDLQELDYTEAAQALGISIGTVKSRIFRGREKLRQMLTRERLYGVARGES